MSAVTAIIERELTQAPLRERAKALAVILNKAGYGTIGVELDLTCSSDVIGYKIALYGSSGTRWYLVMKTGYKGAPIVHGLYGCREDPGVKEVRKFMRVIEKAWEKTKPKKASR